MLCVPQQVRRERLVPRRDLGLGWKKRKNRNFLKLYCFFVSILLTTYGREEGLPGLPGSA